MVFTIILPIIYYLIFYPMCYWVVDYCGCGCDCSYCTYFNRLMRNRQNVLG